ncbi:DJ-1/PfpI family protein [Pseudomonas gingeri]|uniref:DJ-1/PfpI family protein n=1 Tax=Pseudomonas gingeri TaxID=117681 RepID=UPI0015A0CB00|nr:DJ-1/PfpI family protein [Pseudomonas gingeri]NWA24161.1 DJ-1/PfpI family protein [Pseudomonas gingeri]NWD75430.1 DJ-1/PfpI family protein [Pseudomonas gingeri]
MILILLPHSDYDPTESSVPWQSMHRAGLDIRFATPDGVPAYADPRLVEKGFGLLNPMLMTRKPDLESYQAMIADPHFKQPLAYADVDPAQFDALLVPGGHAEGMRSLLESDAAKRIVLHFFKTDKPVASVCHGPLLLARTLDPDTGRSVLYGRKVTGLLSASMELAAWLITAPWLGRYYRTYPHTVESEIKAALASPKDFAQGPPALLRDSANKPGRGFVVRDGNLLTARWPGDCHRLAAEWIQMLKPSRPH